MAASVSAGMSASGPASVQARLHAAFSKPLYQRCVDVTNILTDTNVKELQHVFPLLVENIFGFNQQSDWGVCSVTRKQSQEFSLLQSLLSPEGAVFTLIWKLHSDPLLRYEFPIMALPAPTRCMLEEGVLPQLYVNKIQTFQAHSGSHNIISLNPFEYYMFHFAYLLVNTSNQKQFTTWVNPGDALYPTLTEIYLKFFLPITGKSVPSLPNYTPVRSPVAHHSPVYSCQSQSSPPRRTPPHKSHQHHSLLKSSILLARSPGQQAATVGAAAMFDHTDNEMWRSEALLQIFTEFWMNQNSHDADKMVIAQQKNRAFWLTTNYSSKSGGIIDYFYDCFLPSGVHVRLVRMMVKHLHYFVNSTPSPTVAASSPAGMPQYHSSVSAMDELKRMIWPQTVQKFYAFLKNCFSKWPLDSSFRLVLETWLSFIQPWRYQDPSEDLKDSDKHRTKTVESKWRMFIVENLLFYSKLFQDLLPRLFRLDLSSPKNAYMLFRVCKVFMQTGLKEMIYEAESMLTEPMHHFSPGRQAVTSQDIGASYLSLSHDHSLNSSLVTPMLIQFSELEGPGFQYKLLFGDDTRQMIVQLLSSIQQAKTTAETLQQQTTDNAASDSWMHMLGFGALVDFNAPTFVSSDIQDEFSEVDARKLGQHLDTASNNLRNFFEVKQLPELEKSVRWGGTSADQSMQPSTLLPDHYQTEDGIQITPLGRYQIINGLRKFDISYQGDPDLQPIRSFENGVLVRLLYQVSLYLNHRFGEQITHYYNEEGLLGDLAHQFFQPPEPNPHSTSKSPLTKRQMEWASKPRISLRSFANYENLGYLLALYMFLWLWLGLGVVGFMLIVMFGILAYGLVKSFLRPKSKIKHF